MAETAEIPTPELPVTAPVEEDVAPASVEEAIQIVLRKSLEVNGLVRGLSEVARALDRRTAHLCVLAEDCEDLGYKNLITALCKQNNIDIIKLPERTKLAEWSGLVKTDREGNIKKTFKCSCVAIRDFGERSKALDSLLKHLGAQQ
jgi:small subunit ribosomal protein S12e